MVEDPVGEQVVRLGQYWGPANLIVRHFVASLEGRRLEREKKKAHFCESPGRSGLACSLGHSIENGNILGKAGFSVGATCMTQEAVPPPNIHTLYLCYNLDSGFRKG